MTRSRCWRSCTSIERRSVSPGFCATATMRSVAPSPIAGSRRRILDVAESIPHQSASSSSRCQQRITNSCSLMRVSSSRESSWRSEISRRRVSGSSVVTLVNVNSPRSVDTRFRNSGSRAFRSADALQSRTSRISTPPGVSAVANAAKIASRASSSITSLRTPRKGCRRIARWGAQRCHQPRMTRGLQTRPSRQWRRR